MTSTPERKESTGSSSPQSVRNLVFGSTRRYSRAYDKPIVDSTPKGPQVRVEMEDGTSINPLKSTSLLAEGQGAGKVLNPEAALFRSFLAKLSISILLVFAMIISLVSRSTLLAFSQLLGFMLLFGGVFSIGVLLYFWWSTSNRDTVPMTIRTILYVYVCSALSSFFSQTLSSYTSIPIANSLPQEVSYYIYLATMLFIVFSLLAHRDTLNGMFSQETCLFVSLILALNFISMCLFSDLLPPVVYCQLPVCCMLMGTSLSLAGTFFSHLTPSAIFKVMKQSQVSHHRPASGVGLQVAPARPNRVSEMSVESGRSSVFPRTSVSSFSSQRYSSQVHYWCVCECRV